jgi:hypothetical protein
MSQKVGRVDGLGQQLEAMSVFAIQPMGPPHNIFELSQRFLVKSSQIANLPGFVGVKGGADFFHVGSVRADRFVELVAGDTKLFGPIGDVGGHLGIDLLQVVRSFSMFFVYGVGLMDLGCIAVLGHTFFLLMVLSG